ncbi:hypothetical protein [Rickettsia parkeri]|uniref:hypothetical protein n=1 Tax=Rickettsia parkeri TaxID=35792 RepID=UPI00164A0B88|nr:hypothetical protein [Rickettsia parkeri]
MIYRNELNKLLNAIQQIEPNIKIIKKGLLTKYYYVNNTNRAVNYNEVYYNKKFDRKNAVIEFLKAHPGKEFSNAQIAYMDCLILILMKQNEKYKQATANYYLALRIK